MLLSALWKWLEGTAPAPLFRCNAIDPITGQGQNSWPCTRWSENLSVIDNGQCRQAEQSQDRKGCEDEEKDSGCGATSRGASDHQSMPFSQKAQTTVNA